MVLLEEFFGHLLGKKRWGDGAMRDLDISLRAQGPVHPAYDTMLERCGTFAYVARLLGCTFSVLACMSVMAKMQYYDFQLGYANIVLKYGDEPMKMELAKIILNNHSDDKSLVEAVKRHFVADHLFSDQHQEKPLLRWRKRCSYVDSALLEKMKEHEAALKKMMKEFKAALEKMMKEYEAKNSDDGAKSSKSVGLFQQDPLACMLGTPGNNTEINKPPEQSPASTLTGGTTPTTRELKDHRRSHQHRRHRHADKTVVL